LATRFESNAANIAKVLVKALLNLIITFNVQEIQVVKNSQDHISSVFLCNNSSSKYPKRFAISGYTTMFFCSQLFGFFPLGLCEDSPEIAKFIGKCAENVIA